MNPSINVKSSKFTCMLKALLAEREWKERKLFAKTELSFDVKKF